MLNTSFEFWDYFIFGAYALMIIAVGLWVSRGKKGVQKTTEDYFLASKSLPWWAIGASLIAANISAECGFSSRSYLYRMFKEKEGCSPTAWKEKNC